MFKKRKSTQKDHLTTTNIQHKKIPLLTIPSATVNENRRIQTLPSGESKFISKTMQLKKQPCNSKKTISRKTTSRTNKFQNSLRPVSLQQLLKQVKQIKNYTLNETHSKSKSPLSTQSPSNHKLCPKSLSGTLKNKTNRKKSINISKTLRQLDFTTLFVDQQSNIIYPSASDRPIDKGGVSSSDEIDGINLHEMQQFRSAAIPAQRFKVDIKSHDSLQQTIAAITIQRAYRKYRTKRLIERYSKMNCFTLEYAGSRILGQSQDFYGMKKNRQTKQISDLQEPEEQNKEGQFEDKQYEQLVNSLKMQQIEKWNYILSLINNSKGGSFQDTSRLFKEIEKQSKINREQLLQQTYSQLQSNQLSQPKLLQQQKQLANQNSAQPANPKIYTETDSQAQYDCKKYIEQLDSDVFPQAQSSSSSKGIRLALGITTISTKKQQLLLEQLKNMPKLGENVLVSSSSLKYMHKMSKQLKQQPHSARNRHIMSRCNSQKAIRRTLSNLSEMDVADKIDLKMLQDQFLNEFPIIQQQKIIEDAKNEQTITNRFQQSAQKQQNELIQLIEQKESFFTSNERQITSDIKIEQDEEVQPERLEEIECDNKGLLNISKCVNITAMIIEQLQTQLIQEIVSSIKLGSFFREINNKNKPKVRRAEHNKKKKGFPSDKKEIQNFLENFTNYLLIHHVTALKNLQISTGPSAMELLRYMHTADENSISVNSQQDEGNIMVIPNTIFDLFWKIKEKSIVVEVPPNFTEENSIIFRQNVEYLKSFNKIFYRVLFDTFNQCLDAERNYGILGKPFPWKKSPAFPHKLELADIKQSLRNARARMIEIATTYCGLIVETQDLNIAAGGEQYLQQVQQDRLSKMLATDLIENERRWQFYDDEQAEILIEISNALYQQIVFEVIEDLIDFQ